VKILTTSALALALSSLFFVAGCGSDNNADLGGPPGDDDSGVGVDAGNAGHDSGSNMQVDANTNTCVNPCTSDLACQNSCAAVAGGVNCCDLQTGMCYPSTTACMQPMMDGGQLPD
jgi:hypothetical protein